MPTTEEEEAAKTPAAEILRLLREIHAAVCGDKADAPPKQPREPRVKAAAHIVRLMVEDRPYSPLELHQKLTAEGIKIAPSSVGTAMTSMAKEGKINRLQKSLFQRLPTQGG